MMVCAAVITIFACHVRAVVMLGSVLNIHKIFVIIFAADVQLSSIMIIVMI